MQRYFYSNLQIILFVLLLSIVAVRAQNTEILTNAQIVEMTEAGVSSQIILTKINSSAGDYDVSARALVALKKANVADDVVAAMLGVFNQTNKQNLSETAAPPTPAKPVAKPDVNKTAAQLLNEARTILFVKHSLYPALSDLESSILKRPGWQAFNLSVTRRREEADLVVEINHEFLTHYAFRVVDAKSGRVIAASGVTSLGGALAGNIADKLIKRFNEVLVGK